VVGVVGLGALVGRWGLGGYAVVGAVRGCRGGRPEGGAELDGGQVWGVWHSCGILVTIVAVYALRMPYAMSCLVVVMRP
jgi:hypothetical protein